MLQSAVLPVSTKRLPRECIFSSWILICSTFELYFFMKNIPHMHISFEFQSNIFNGYKTAWQEILQWQQCQSFFVEHQVKVLNLNGMWFN